MGKPETVKTSTKLSGAQRRKLNKVKIEKIKKLQESAKNFFLKNKFKSKALSSTSESTLATQQGPTTQVASNYSEQNDFEDLAAALIPPEDSASSSTQEGTFDKTVDQTDLFDITDPSTWPLVLSQALRHKILTEEISFKWENSESNLEIYRFWKKHFNGKKANGEIFSRTWLRVSKLTNSVFCMPCCLFGQQYKSPWSIAGPPAIGFKDFKHSTRAVSYHEESLTHFESIRNWKLYLKNLQSKSSFVSMINQQSEEVTQHWRLVLRGILDAVLFLAQNNLSLQGSSHNIQDDNCGNFLNLIKLLARYYVPLAEHVDRLKKNSVSYLSPLIQNEFIHLCGTEIRNKILEQIRERKYFAIMFDSTPDVSRTDQLSQIIRSVRCSPDGCIIEENFIDFLSTSAKSGDALSKCIIEKLESDGLNLENCKGQGYDNGSNMAGIYNGVQARILKKNVQARFIPCAAHSLNLVGVNAAEKVLGAKLLLGEIQNLYVFFSASTSRWKLLKAKTHLSLKSQSTTRWSSKYRAVDALCKQFSEVTQILCDIAEIDDFSADALAAANSQLKFLATFRFLLGLEIWNHILYQLDDCNVSLQKQNIDVNYAEKKLGVLHQWLLQFKTEGFETCLIVAQKKAITAGINLETGFNDVRKGRGISYKYNNASTLARIRDQSNLERFKTEFFEALLDKLLQEISGRFHLIRQCSEYFLWGNGLFLSIEEKEEYAKLLVEKYPEDFVLSSFTMELQTLELAIRSFSSVPDIATLKPLDVLNVLHKNDLVASYYNTDIALRIFLTLPVSVASNERAFSKLALIKNYRRSSMGQERLNGLAIISIERDVAKNKLVQYRILLNAFYFK